MADVSSETSKRLLAFQTLHVENNTSRGGSRGGRSKRSHLAVSPMNESNRTLQRKDRIIGQNMLCQLVVDIMGKYTSESRIFTGLCAANLGIEGIEGIGGIELSTLTADAAHTSLSSFHTYMGGSGLQWKRPVYTVYKEIIAVSLIVGCVLIAYYTVLIGQNQSADRQFDWFMCCFVAVLFDALIFELVELLWLYMTVPFACLESIGTAKRALQNCVNHYIKEIWPLRTYGSVGIGEYTANDSRRESPDRAGSARSDLEGMGGIGGTGGIGGSDRRVQSIGFNDVPGPAVDDGDIGEGDMRGTTPFPPYSHPSPPSHFAHPSHPSQPSQPSQPSHPSHPSHP
jgi:hypothetical protein